MSTLPTPLQGQRILLGLSGGIAAYKSAYLARRLIEAGAEVRVVMTEGAQAFITPLTLQALTGNPVHTALLDEAAEAGMGHIELARWASLILIAPATADIIARLAHGMADDLLTTLVLASDAPVYLAPAMNRLMWANPATVANCATLRSRGATLLGPAEGVQACGETGAGRMLEPDTLCEQLQHHLESRHAGIGDSPRVSAAVLDADHPDTADPSASLTGLSLLITAGPTVEPIDPVRYISNHSSGKMGYAIAAAAAAMGARVTLVSGPVRLDTPAGVRRVDVQSAADMLEAVMARVDEADVFISVAAVADYRVAQIADQKIKKNAAEMHLTLVKNPDILRSVAALDPGPFCVGFAAETENIEAHARAKLDGKRLDMIAANDVGDADNPVFGADRNALQVFWPGGQAAIAAAEKPEVARQLLELLAARLHIPDSSTH